MERFSQSTNDYKNTDFVDSSGRVILRTLTPFKFFGTTSTTIERFTADSSGKVVVIPVAEIEYHGWRQTRFRFRGRDLGLDEYLERKGIMGSKRRFIAGSGRAYSWSTGSSPYLLALDDKRAVGSYHKRSLGIFSQKYPAYLEVHTDLLMDLEEIVMMLVYMLHREEQRRRSNAAASAGGGGGC